MIDEQTDSIVRFNMKLLAGNRQPYEMEYQLSRLPEGIVSITYPVIADSINGRIFYVGGRDLNPELASEVISHPNVSYAGTVTVTIDRTASRRMLSIQNASNTAFGRGVLEITEDRYNALYAVAAEPAGYVAR